MCSVCCKAIGLSMPAIGSTFATRPCTTSKPAGAFIHALAITTKIPEAAPLTATMMPAHRCARGEIRSQPYR